MRAPCAIYSGQTLMIDVVGVFPHVELGTPLARLIPFPYHCRLWDLQLDQETML